MPAAVEERQLAPQIDAPARQPHSDYIYGIDLVRFACALCVAAFHLTWKTPETAWFLPFGWVGVQVFFVISGLVIANSAQGATPPQFLTGRFMRIYPTAWCAAAVSYPLFLWQFPNMVDPLQRLYFSLILFPGPFIATAYWTLPIELAFYFVVYSLIVFNGFRHVRWLAVFLILWGAPCVVGLALNARGLAHWNWINFTYLWENMSLLRYGPYFGLGMLVWLYKEKRAGIIAFAAAALALALGLMEIYAKTAEVLPKFAQSTPALQQPWTHLPLATNLAFLAAFAAILLAVKFNRLFPVNARLRKTVRTLGLMTYPFYLLHELVGAFVIAQTSKLGMTHLTSVFIALATIGLVSLVIAIYCEPALRRALKLTGRILSPTAKKPAFKTT
jgi:exopolysaccharide production protein ExoZ